ncbi:DNA repair and recombination protein RadA [Candidatus Korarchaeum cryptofilum]|uniref:DNA repair and recombination protein RadA n=1 Tax=Korarchaeum cryptofilum (strain OPF8) TaxID=374847 RepID=B1L679_KORCO|nr:DNA repair and recombination protein RadA [Candidatus Korarchaeum cryptofilum]ACB07958.1 DNA repair and recombination protein RadA [Candidatus Korarchaeum cryptofilum OPF8]
MEEPPEDEFEEENEDYYEEEVDVSGDYDLTELEGVGPATAKRLAEAGFTSLESIAMSTPSELAVYAGISEAVAQKIIQAARSKLNIDVMSAYDFYQQRKAVQRITTGSKALDELLGGGVETQSITEIYGPYGSGKTQFCHQMAVTVQLDEEKGGLGRGAMYIDTEGTFRPERILQIAERFKLDPEHTLKNILYARAFTSDHQMIVTERAESYIKERDIGLIIVDSLISHFRGEYVGRETLAERQQKLNKYLHKLLRLALGYNMAVIVTNQVVADPTAFFGDPNKPAGGHVLGHGVTARLYIKRGKKDRRVIKLVKSPYLPEGTVEVAITQGGIEDV